MSIVLLILKIIGITLLSILALLLLVICLVLFVPIRYRLEGSKDLNDTKFLVTGKVTYLLHIVNAYVKYYEKLEYALRLFIFKLISSDKKEKPEKPKRNRRKTENPKAEKEELKEQIEQADTESEFTNTEGLDFTFDRNEDELLESQEVDSQDENTGNESSDQKEEKTPLLEKIASFIEKALDFILDIPDKVEAAINKVNDIKENADYYIEAINDEKNKEAIALCVQSLLKILKSIRPRKIKGYIHIGKEDPYTMGKILSIYSMIYPLTHDKIKFESEFDEELLEGNLFIKGKVTVIVLVIAAVRIYFNKNVRNLIKVLKREEGK